MPVNPPTGSATVSGTSFSDTEEPKTETQPAVMEGSKVDYPKAGRGLKIIDDHNEQPRPPLFFTPEPPVEIGEPKPEEMQPLKTPITMGTSYNIAVAPKYTRYGKDNSFIGSAEGTVGTARVNNLDIGRFIQLVTGQDKAGFEGFPEVVGSVDSKKIDDTHYDLSWRTATKKDDNGGVQVIFHSIKMTVTTGKNSEGKPKTEITWVSSSSGQPKAEELYFSTNNGRYVAVQNGDKDNSFTVKWEIKEQRVELGKITNKQVIIDTSVKTVEAALRDRGDSILRRIGELAGK